MINLVLFAICAHLRLAIKIVWVCTELRPLICSVAPSTDEIRIKLASHHKSHAETNFPNIFCSENEHGAAGIRNQADCQDFGQRGSGIAGGAVIYNWLLLDVSQPVRCPG
jgi:hypothetical protein